MKQKKILSVLLFLSGISFIAISQNLPGFVVTRDRIEPVILQVDSVKSDDLLPGVQAWGRSIVVNGTVTDIPNGIQINGSMAWAFATLDHVYDIDLLLRVEVEKDHLKLTAEVLQAWQSKGNKSKKKVDLTYHDFFKENGDLNKSYKSAKGGLQQSLNNFIIILYKYLRNNWVSRLRQTEFERGYMRGNERFSVWQYYNREKQVELVVNHSSGKVRYVMPDSTKYPVYDGNTWVYSKIDIRPIPLTGFHNFYEAIRKVVKYRIYCMPNQRGNVVIGFVIDTLGAVTNPHIIKGLGNPCDSSLLKSLKTIKGRWVPAQLGKTRMPVGLAINFVLPDGKEKSEGRKNLGLDNKTAKLLDEIVIDTPMKENRIFTFVEESAEPVGGMEAFYKWVAENLKYPKSARNMGIEGKVFVRFIVEPSGEITNVEIVKGFYGDCDKEAVRVISISKWKPGRLEGFPVRQAYTLPIAFKLSDLEKNPFR